MQQLETVQREAASSVMGDHRTTIKMIALPWLGTSIAEKNLLKSYVDVLY